MSESLLLPLLSLGLHTGLFLTLAWLVERAGWVRLPRSREYLWRSAMFGGVLSAALQLLNVPAPLGGAWVLPISAPVATTIPTRVGAVDAGARSAAESAPVVASGERVAAGQALRSGVDQRDEGRASAVFSARPQSPAGSPVGSGIVAYSPYILIANAIVVAWLAGFLLLLLRLLGSVRSLARLLADAEPIARADLHDDLAALSASLAIAVPRIVQSRAIASPVATPTGVVVLPAWALDLPRDERRALLAHELAHLQRRDPRWRVVAELWRALLCCVPLTRVAVRRLEAIAELECDAAAARVLGDGRPLAACLARYLELRAQPDLPLLAVAMAAPRSPLLQRAERLLEGVPMSVTRIPLSCRLLPFAAVIAAALALPILVVQPSVAAETQRESGEGFCFRLGGKCLSTQINESDGVMTIKVRGNGGSLDYKSNGDVRFNDAESDIVSLGGNGQVALEETASGVTRRIEYKATGSGIDKLYWRDGNAQALDPDAQAWLAAVIPRLLREAGVDVKGRVARLHQRGGTQAVLTEINAIRSDYVKARYVGQLVGTHSLNAGELDETLKQVALIDSDYELRNALQTIIGTQQLAGPQLDAVMKIAALIESDYERAELLVASTASVAEEPALREGWLKAAAEIESSYERRRTLQSLLRLTSRDTDLAAILAAAVSIDSDYEKREVLSAVADKVTDAEAIAPAFARAAAGIASDYERREALLAFVRIGKLQRDGALAVLDAIAGIDSDYECGTVLVALARTMPKDDSVQQRYLQVASKLGDYEREKAESAVGVARG